MPNDKWPTFSYQDFKIARDTKLDNKEKFKPVNVAILTVSDSRIDSDKSGDYLVNSIIKEGHVCDTREIVKDDVDKILKELNSWLNNTSIDVIIITGGTGITGRDVTPEAINKVGRKRYTRFWRNF